MLPERDEVGKLGAVWLKRLWASHMTLPKRSSAERAEEWQAWHTVLSALELAQEPTVKYLHTQRPSFEQFEDWILEFNGGVIDKARIERLNDVMMGREVSPQVREMQNAIEAMDPVLDADALAHWDEHGWVLLKNAISAEAAEQTAQVVWQAQGMDADDPNDWGRRGPLQQCVFVQMFRHPVLDANRHSARIHKAYAQLWGRTDLWATTDRIGFNAPVTPEFPFPGPGIHWDVSLVQPIPFGIQGLIYLTDTAADQGAFALVPGMHRTIGPWLQSLPEGVDPRQYACEHLSMTPIAGQAGDMVLWHQALAHGPTPNRASVPRLVHYLTMFPADFGFIPEWL